MSDNEERDDFLGETPEHASSDELQSLPDDGDTKSSSERSSERSQPLTDPEHDESSSEGHGEITENYASQAPHQILPAQDVPKSPPSAGHNAGEDDTEQLWKMSGFLNNSNEPTTGHIGENLIEPALDSTEQFFKPSELEFSTAGLPIEATVGEEGQMEEDEELEDYVEYENGEFEDGEKNEEEEREEEMGFDMEKELENEIKKAMEKKEDGDDDNSSTHHIIADLLAELDTSIATSRATAKYAAVPSLSTIEEVSETPTPERRRTSLQQDHQINDIAKARTIDGDAVFMETRHDDADNAREPEEVTTVEMDIDERLDATQRQSSPGVETEELPAVEKEVPKGTQSDGPEDQITNESSIEESLPASDKIGVQEHVIPEEVPETQNSSDQRTKEMSPQESPSNCTQPGVTDSSSRSSSLSHQSMVKEGLSSVHTSPPEEATQNVPTLLSPISPLELANSSERRRSSVRNSLSPYRKASLPAVAVYSPELQPSAPVSPKAAKDGGNDAPLDPSDQKHLNPLESAEQSAITPDPGSPSCPPSPSQTVPPFVDTPPPLEPQLPQTAKEEFETDANDPSKPVGGSTPGQLDIQQEHMEPPATQQELTQPPDTQQEATQPLDIQQEPAESLGSLQELPELTMEPTESLPAPFTLSPETLEFLAKLPLPPLPPPPAAPQQQPELSSYPHTRPPVLDWHPRHPERNHPHPSHLLDSYRPGLPTTTATTAPETAAAASLEAWTHTLSAPLLLRHAFLGNLPRRPPPPPPYPSTTTTKPPPQPQTETHTLTHTICPHRTLVLTRRYTPLPPCPRCHGRGTVLRNHNHRSSRRPAQCLTCLGRGRAHTSTTAGIAPGARFIRAEGPKAEAVGGFVEGWGVKVVRERIAASDGTGCVDDGGRCRRGDAWREGDWETELLGEVVGAMGRFVREREGAGAVERMVVGERGGRCWREIKTLLVMGRMGERKRERLKERVRKRGGERREEEDGARKRRKVDV
ncbi:hypothetical protein BFW01_g2079 [Lasiodiplodia theobromae]|nr:hypothetical protein BFW01_g2079 [Lasiodiplodia theobromae]